MAFLLVSAAVKAIKSGVAAHNDFNNPEGSTPVYDRRGRSLNSGPIYDMVTKAEMKLAAKKVQRTVSATDSGRVPTPPMEDVQMKYDEQYNQTSEKSVYRESNYESLPPSYDVVAGSSSHPYPLPNRGLPAPLIQNKSSGTQRPSESSDSDSDSDASDEQYQQIQQQYIPQGSSNQVSRGVPNNYIPPDQRYLPSNQAYTPSRRDLKNAYKAEEKALKAEKKAAKRQYRADKLRAKADNLRRV